MHTIAWKCPYCGADNLDITDTMLYLCDNCGLDYNIDDLIIITEDNNDNEND